MFLQKYYSSWSLPFILLNRKIFIISFCIIAAPNPPESVVFYNHTETSLNVSWTPGDKNTVGINYSVSLVGNKRLRINTTATFHVFENLTSGTMYNASVVAYQQNGEEYETRLQSDPTFNSTYTRMLHSTVVYIVLYAYPVEVSKYVCYPPATKWGGAYRFTLVRTYARTSVNFVVFVLSKESSYCI